MNSLNTDTVSSLNPAKYRPIDVPSQFYPQNVYYHIQNNGNINPEFASLQNSYGANSLLATQFSFQYSDNQGLGEGLAGGNHSGQWQSANGNQSRNNPPIDPSHFYSLPSHGHAQTADQNLFYPYGYSTANNMYWPHPSVLEYKSNNQNFSVPSADKNQAWPDTIVSNQYSPLANTLNYKSNLSSSLDQGNHLMSINNSNNSQSSYEVQIGTNGYNLAQVAAGKLLGEDAVTSKTDSGCLSSTEVDSLQAQMAAVCSLHADNNNHPYSQAFSKQSLNGGGGSSNTNSAPTDFWGGDTGSLSLSNATKSYAKVAKLPSRSVSNLPSSSSSSSAYFNVDNGYNSNAPPRPSYKSTTNGFATGFVRPSVANNNWFNNSSLNGPNWNTTKTKWNPEGNMSTMSQALPDPASKSSWASKVPLSNTDEYLRTAEFKIKEIQLQINPKRLDINFEKTRYFVIKSYSEDDVHRSIKYKIWCSTKEGNRRLNEAFQGAQKTGGHVLLFFSVNGSGHFCGVAEMISPVDESVITGVWCQDKWRGKFSVKWLYVKDVPNTQLRHISTKVKIQKGNGETSTEVKPITNLRDATELKSDRGSGSSYKDDIGYQALKIIMDCKSTMSIFDDFLHYEKRELSIEN